MAVESSPADHATAEFVLGQLEPRPGRVLEVGCGEGGLAEALSSAGYDVTAIDPRAPSGPIFRKLTLEEFAEPGPFDAVVAIVALHHIEDLGAALDKVRDLLRPGGLLVLEEFAKERFLDERTARWYWEQRQALEAAGPEGPRLPLDFDQWRDDWATGHADVHRFDEIHRELGARFVERSFAWAPYLYRYDLDETIEPLEASLIASGGIEATGTRYVGQRPG
jgi:SAM-dependent methyltransferase